MAKKTKQRKSQASLQFSQGGDLAGFSSSGVAGFQDLNPAAVVRELLQNSLDAVRETDRNVARIRFEITETLLKDIPGIKEYKEVFKRAVDAQKKQMGSELPDQAKIIVDSIKQCLSSKKVKTLFVLDNGIGLDKKRMQGLLADGVSVKSDASTGAVGNGHLVVLPASDIRYVLYGGRTQKEGNIGSGHTILATHEKQRKRRGKDGYFVKNLNEGLFPFEFLENNEIPKYIGDKLQWIAKNFSPDEKSCSGEGTVVAIPGFNDFREDREDTKTLWKTVSKSIACNFFAAFVRDELHVEFVEKTKMNVLSKSNIRKTLEEFSKEKRTRNKFISGSRAFDAFNAMENGKEILVNTDIGEILMKIIPIEEGKTRLHLCRNGMWVTDDLPKLNENKFSGFESFHCVLLLDAKKGGELHKIVRKAEGPLHNNLDTKKWLKPVERNKLNKAMEKILSSIKENIQEHNDAQFKVPDIFTVNTGGFSSGGRKTSLLAKNGNFIKMKKYKRPTTQIGKNVGITPKSVRLSSSKPFDRTGENIQFRALCVPTGHRSCSVDLTSGEQSLQSEVRFILDEGLDESCDDSWLEKFVKLENVKINGRKVDNKDLKFNNDKEALGISVPLEKDNQINIEFDYDIPKANKIKLSTNNKIVLKTQIVRRHKEPE